MYCLPHPISKVIPQKFNTPSFNELMGVIEGEIWKPILNWGGEFKDAYEVSNIGRVRSVARFNVSKNRIMSPVNSTKGYVNVKLCKFFFRKSIPIHRLVAVAFLPNPNNYPQVNHKNGLKKDNRVENLEWCSPSANQRHAIETGLRKPELHKLPASAIRIHQYDLQGNYLNTFESISKAARSIGCHAGNINEVLSTTHYSNNFFWVKDGDSLPDFSTLRKKELIEIDAFLVYTVKNMTRGNRYAKWIFEKGELVYSGVNAVEAAKLLKIGVHDITTCLEGKRRSVNGYIIEYVS